MRQTNTGRPPSRPTEAARCTRDAAAAVGQPQSAHGGTGQRAGGELRDDPRQPAPRRVEVAAGQQHHHRRQRRRECQHHEAARPRRLLHPQQHQHQQGEKHVRQPFGADRPGRPVPARVVEERHKPQLHQQDLPHVADRGERGGVRRRHVAHVQGEDHPQGGEVQCDQVHRPYPGQPQPQEVQGGAGRPGPAHPVEVVVRQHEAAEDEKRSTPWAPQLRTGASASRKSGEASPSIGRK